MEKIRAYIKEIWENSINSIDHKTLDEIYAFSFYVYDDEDDPRYPTLTIGFNTHSHFQNEINNASGENEARWNYAYWLQNEIAVIGHEEDEEGKRIIKDWIAKMGLSYTDQEEGADIAACVEKGEKITQNFVEVLIEIVRETHQTGKTTKPILIHELEYYDQIRDQNIEANGKERVIEFTNWINEM